MVTRTQMGMFLAGMVLVPLFALAQPADAPAGSGGAGGFGPGGPGGPGGFNMLDMVKEQLGASDEEWKVIEPKIQKVMDAQRLAGNGRGGRGRGFGPGGPDGQGARNGPAPIEDAVSRAMTELRTALESTTTPPESMQAKMTALRTARERARVDLAAARKELSGVLTARQEAVLVTFGFLD